MKKITTLLLTLAVLLTSVEAFAGYDVGKITRVYGATTIYFGIENPNPADTCNYYYEQFKFDDTTENGKNMLSMILAAQAGNRNVAVWYSASSQPGTDQENGCSGSALATASSVGVYSQ